MKVKWTILDYWGNVDVDISNVPQPDNIFSLFEFTYKYMIMAPYPPQELKLEIL